MKAKELRIGNLVQVNGVEYKIHSIHSPEPMKDENFSNKFYVRLWNNGLTSCLLSDLEPVPLTREKLFMFGFEDISNDVESVFIKGNFCFYGSLNEVVVELDDGETEYDLFTECKFAHKLQNLWLDLTEEELL